MTDPDPIATLAAQVEQLRGLVERYQAIVTSWDARLEAEGIGATMTLLLEVKKLRERLDKALAKGELDPPYAPWWVVSRAESQAMLAELCEWVESFLRPHYPGYMARLPRCWANHAEAVWELSTLRAEWGRVYDDPDNRDLMGALIWHDKFFPDVLARLAGSIKCDQSGCRVARNRPQA